ncbi:MAG: MFS transporter [Trueperaceae bacterium]
MGHAPLPASEPPPSAPFPSPPGAAAYLTDLDPPVRAQVRRTMRLTILEGSFTQVFLNWTTGSVLVGFMLHLGAAPTELALVSAAPHLSQLASPFAAYLAALLGRRKALTVTMALAARLTWLLAAALPAFGLPDAARPWALIGLVLVSSLFLASHNTVWTAWMGDVVPERERGRAFGLRTGVMGVVGTAANLGAGAFLDRVGAPLSFQVVLLVAVVAGLVGAAVVAQQFDPPTAVERVRWRQLLTLPWRDRGFRRLLRFTAYWNFVVMLSGPFVTPFYLQELGMTFTQVALAGTLTALTALVTTPLWGRVTDRVGHKRVLMLGTFLVGLLLPGGWIVAGLTGSLAWIWATSVADAFAWGAVRLAAFNLALASAPRTNRVVFIAMLGLATGVSGFLGGAIAGPLLLALQRLDVTVLGARPSGYVWLFAVALLLRTQAWWWLRSVPDDGGGRPGLLLRDLGAGLRGPFSRHRRRP